ncbi:hypothetical protein AMTR_s00138p00070850 [Amborella trichopoda]|uniref:Uncharacterized protein n=1 Tax=Amborella trichopoda TaxID=13333 RepID=W1NEJ8_AMBTC|nr:hypothetical protein AMTR_s00138p00070850 [Amborella trichopoda]
MAVSLSEAEQKCIIAFAVAGLVSSSEEVVAVDVITMFPEEILEAGLMLDPKSMEIESLREMVVRLRRKAEHHQNMSNFYRGEVE